MSCAPRLALALLAAAACSPALPAAPTDVDGDGYPDAAQLRSEDDRRAFSEAFTAVALAQVKGPEATFDPAQRDCAGLVRYAYREALKRHGAGFAARHPGLARLPEVRAFQYPEVPFLKTRLFRVRPGPFDAARIEEDFSEAPEAVRLAEGSARRLSGPPSRGDLALFQSAGGTAHLMIVAEEGADPLFAYHTGPHDGGPGEVRRALLSTLLRHPDSRWRPVAANPDFRGYYRFRILEGP